MYAERFEMMVELNKMDDNKELAKAVVDEMERRKKLEGIVAAESLPNMATS